MTQVAVQMGANQKRLPEFKPSVRVHDIWSLGDSDNRSELSAILNGFKDFAVVDSVSEDHLKKIVRDIQASRWSRSCPMSGRPLERNILHSMLSSYVPVHDGLMKGVLALGIDPDLQTGSKQTLAHLCSLKNRYQCVEAIGMCRPDLSAMDRNGDTPDGVAIRQGFSHSSIWDDVKDGFPTIAQLAREEKWWAVNNLTRRRVIPEAEMFKKYAGKDAIEWAKHHGKQRIAEELWYLFGKSTHCRLVKLESKADEDSEKVNARFEKFQTEFQAYQAKLEADLDVLKEGITICTSRIGEIATFQEESDELMLDEAVDESKVENIEDKIMSKVDAQFEKFQQEFRDLKRALKARDKMVETQMKAVQEEVAKLSITRPRPGVPAPPNAPQDPLAMQRSSASHSIAKRHRL